MIGISRAKVTIIASNIKGNYAKFELKGNLLFLIVYVVWWVEWAPTPEKLCD